MKRFTTLVLATVFCATAAPSFADSLDSNLLRPKDIPKPYTVEGPPICFSGTQAASLEKPKVRDAALKAGLTGVCEILFTDGVGTIESHVMSFSAKGGTQWGMQYVPSYARRKEPAGWKSQKIPKIADGSAAMVHRLTVGGKVIFTTVYLYWHKGSKVGWILADGTKLTMNKLVALAKVQAGRM